MITPTPRAISPQDIVRIYVPPAPPEEKQQQQKQSTKESQPNNSTTNSIPRNLNNNKVYSSINSVVANGKTQQQQQRTPPTRPTLSGLEQESNRNSIIYGSDDLTPVHYTFNQSDDELMKSFGNAMLNSSNSLNYIGTGGDQRSLSSSRRGSLSGKTPPGFKSNELMECSHMIKRRLSSQSNSSINFEIGPVKSNVVSSTENLRLAADRTSNDFISLQSFRRNSASNSEREVIMTSFERLATESRQRQHHQQAAEQKRIARKSESDDTSNNRQYNYDNENSPDDDENYSYSYYNSYKSAESRQRKNTGTVVNSKRFVSESSIQYESVKHRTPQELGQQANNKRRPNSSGNETLETSPFHAAPNSKKTTSIKEYKRFYSTSVEDAYETIKPDEEPKKSSDESSSSPNSKSILNTPVNETIPLLQSSPVHGTHRTIYGDVIDTGDRSQPANVPLSSSVSPKKSNSSPTKIQISGSVQQTDKVTSPTSAVRPSRIPLMQSNQKYVTKSPSSTIQSTSPLSPNELNRVLPPVEINSNNNVNSSYSRKIKAPSSSTNGQAGYSGSGASGRSKKHQSQNNGAIGACPDANTIRIKVNQNDK